MQVQGSIALVTGANGGIGRQFVDSLRAANAQKIYVCARNIAKLDSLVALDPDRIVPIELEVTKPESVQAAVASCSDVTLLINNAGTSLNQGIIAADNLDSARSEIEVNYFGMCNMCRAFAPVLKANGGGAIVNVVSLLAKVSLPFSGSYSASKAAALSATHCIRAELGSQGTLVVAVMPGTVDTDLAKDWPDPKVSPAEVARTAIHAVEEQIEDVYPGEQATQVAAQLLQDPKGVEKYLGTFLPGMMLAGTQA
jgi:NAD(P)-dependent dehydrogenase (short-subunit alcohol dehydrogenase family)